MRRGLRCGEYLLLCSVLGGVTVRAAAQQTDGPQVTAVEPKRGVTTPGTKVRIYGTALSPDTTVYFGGLQVRVTNFISPSTLDVITPYLRPGNYKLQITSGRNIIRSEVSFTALPAPVDSEIDRALALVGEREATAAIAILTELAKTNSDYQVRAFAYYQVGQIYFGQGDWWRWAGVPIFLDSDKAGAAVSTSWRYRLSMDQADYFLPTNNDLDHDLKLANWTVEKDVTQNPEPRFYRGLINARYGNLQQAKTDSDFVLAQEPKNLSYRALAVYIAVLSGDKAQLQSFNGESITEARALSLLGEAAYLSGDVGGAQLWWTQEAKIYSLGGSLAYWAGKKHLARGQQRVAEALLAECTAVVPNSKEAQEAKDLLSSLRMPVP